MSPAKIGIPYHDNDFGITLGKGGAAEGSYLVLPFVGPKPPRDLVGTGVDIAFDPLTYMTWNNSTLYMIIRAGLGVLDSRAANIDAVESIERSSIDFYATTRSLYRQNRAAQIDGEAATPTCRISERSFASSKKVAGEPYFCSRLCLRIARLGARCTPIASAELHSACGRSWLTRPMAW